MHNLLKRQLKKTGATVDKKFLALVNQAYVDAEEDRKLLENSLEVSSQEMQELYDELARTSAQKIKQSQDKYDKLVYALRDHYIFFDFNKQYEFTYLSDSVYNISGYPHNEIINTKLTNYLTNDSINKEAMKSFNKLLAGEQQKPVIISVKHKNGNTIYLEITSYQLCDTCENVLEIQGIARDVTERYESEQKLHYLSNHDPLTGIANRYSLYNNLDFIITDSKRNQKTFALLYLDLDGFKSVNDTLGHDTGDLLLQEVTQRIKKHIRENDIFARVGGDEFAIVLTDVEHAFISKITQTILTELNKSFLLQNREVKISASIGIATYPKTGEDIETLIKSADAAMYSVKNDGKNNFSIS